MAEVKPRKEFIVDWTYPISSLSFCTRLEHIEISSCLLFGIRKVHSKMHIMGFLKTLPPSLKTLVLQDCNGSEWVYVSRLVLEKELWTPKLDCVRMHRGKERETLNEDSVEIGWIGICEGCGDELQLPNGSIVDGGA